MSVVPTLTSATFTGTASARNSLRVAVIADSDTRWKWGALTARRIAEGCADAELTGFLLRGRATPTARQLSEVGADLADPREVTGAEFLASVERGPYDVVVLALVGGSVQALLHGMARLWPGPQHRPVLVTGYVGVVYEKLTDGLLLRHGADLVLANSPYDERRFTQVYEGVGADASAVTRAALPFLGGAPYAGVADAVVFAAQPSVPERRADRAYLLRRLVQHARLHPGREVVLKLRSKPGEHTTHIEELPYQRLVRDLAPPANFRLAYGHMGEILDRAGLLVTVSSTAALESLHRGIPTAILTDLGVREPLGNHYFLGSGCLTSWDALDAGHRPEASGEWLRDQGVVASGDSYDPYDAVRDRIADLLARPVLPSPSPYYSPATATGYLPGILARHRLDEAPRGEVSRARRLVREAARGAYRHGVQRVAPVIRRMGEL
ncbi:hypothetical protein GCM10010329_04580 [Streptomyces spiroverticillatus]|uniref:Uncharacterized protein n=1 Tax=Streptomyces finlayi TaxID=67296 RepID=A0A919C7B9_9ACTN|nr:hypothetical protein GCM10010329_04580 [Streptomyces spiroverticillatus]GHC78848.1 hypothetical protein GCM10010334_04560 [Streptomyces finlayi]